MLCALRAVCRIPAKQHRLRSPRTQITSGKIEFEEKLKEELDKQKIEIEKESKLKEDQTK